MSVIDRFLTYLSSQNSHTLLTRLPSESSLHAEWVQMQFIQKKSHLTPQIPCQSCNPWCSHSYHSALFARSLMTVQQNQETQEPPKYWPAPLPLTLHKSSSQQTWQGDFRRHDQPLISCSISWSSLTLSSSSSFSLASFSDSNSFSLRIRCRISSS